MFTQLEILFILGNTAQLTLNGLACFARQICAGSPLNYNTIKCISQDIANQALLWYNKSNIKMLGQHRTANA
jgi:hypothetical protein